jgi:ABC-2 type transport system ATP-binding protein
LKKFRSEGGTVFLSTHILSDLQELADEIIMINEGKVIYSGKKDTNVEELYKKLIIEQKPDGVQTSTEKKGVNYF